VPVERALDVALRDAEVCGLADGRCVSGRQAAAIHGGDPVVLPAGTSTNLYLRLPARSRLRFEFRAAGASLALVAEPADAAPVVLFRSAGDAADDRWHAVEVATRLPEGTIVRLGLAVEPMAPGSGGALVRRPLLAGLTPPPVPPAPPAGARPNVLVYLVDTLRADRLGCYGYGAPTSPHIDAFAAEALRFANAVAQSSWTRPSTASIFTGLVPPRHGAVEADRAIRPDVATLPELLRRAGYSTAGFVTNSVAAAPFGFARGFDRFHYYPESKQRSDFFLPGERLLAPVAHWLERAPRPFFLYVHVADPHSPYVPPGRFRRGLVRAAGGVTPAVLLAEQLRCPTCLHALGEQRPAPITRDTAIVLSALYDAEVARTDAAFGRLVELLRRRRLLDTTLVIFTSDHGEEFLEHGGVTHGKTLHREVLHVPLLARLPGGTWKGRTEARVVQHADLLPSILDVVGVDVPPGLDGERVLRSYVGAREVSSHLDHEGRRVMAITDDRWTFVYTLEDRDGIARPMEIFDLRADPLEADDLAARNVVLATYARERLRERSAETATLGPTVDPGDLARLRALGYVGF